MPSHTIKERKKNPTVNQRIKQLENQKDEFGGRAEAQPPSPKELIQQVKERSTKRKKRR